jgi:hypothetical protein
MLTNEDVEQSEAFAKCFPEEEFYLDADSISGIIRFKLCPMDR